MKLGRQRQDPFNVFALFVLCVFVILLILALGGCTTAQVTEDATAALAADDYQKLRDVLSADYETAMTLADQAGDAAALQCYPALRQCVGAIVEFREARKTGDMGVLSTYQLARSVRLGLHRETPYCGRRLHLACAAMADESRGALTGLLKRLGVGLLVP